MPKGIKGFQKGHKSYMTEEIKGKIRLAFKGKYKGSNNPNWQGGKYKDSEGYTHILKPNHPFANRGYVLKSRLVMEKMIGRYLKPEEVVHHINGIKDDDRPENLRLFANKSKHAKSHFSKGSYFGIHN